MKDIQGSVKPYFLINSIIILRVCVPYFIFYDSYLQFTSLLEEKMTDVAKRVTGSLLHE